MEYEIDRIIQDANMPAILKELGYKLNFAADHESNGNKLPIICDHHKHRDGNFGTASLIVRGGGKYKGMHCFLCANSWNLITLVQEKLGCNYWTAVKYIADRSGGLEQYAIPGTENDYDRRMALLNGHKIEDAAFPSPLTYAECEALELNMNIKRDSNFISGAIVNAYDYKPKFLDDDENVITVIKPNENWNKNIPSVYASFQHYCLNRKNPNGQDIEPLNVSYLIAKQVNMNLFTLYKEDKDAYWQLVYYRAQDMLELVEQRIEKIANFKILEFVNERNNLLQRKAILEGIIKRYTLTEDMMDIIAKQYNNSMSA